MTVLLARSPATVPSKHTDRPRCRRRSEIDNVIRNLDCLRFVLHHQHGIALVAQPQQQVVHALDVVRVETGGGLIEDVGDIGSDEPR